jgi:hypothetical protein
MDPRGANMKEPVDHIVRPRLPWRPESDPAITECGYNAASVKALSREDYLKRVKQYGPQRTGLVTCMTCMYTASRWPTWQDDPRLAVSREVEWEAPHWGLDRKIHERRGCQLRDELLAIELLIAAHAEEFRQLLGGIDARRQWVERKSRNEKAQ